MKFAPSCEISAVGISTLEGPADDALFEAPADDARSGPPLRCSADLATAIRHLPHRAMSFEDRAVMCDHLGSRDVADDLRRWAKLDSLRRGDIALDLAGHDDRIRAN